MGKIVKFRTRTDNTLEFLDMLKFEVANLEIDNMMIACKCKDGSILTGYTKNLDYGTKMELKSHVEMDIIKEMIENNFTS
jgi:hypothetical protein